MVHDFRYGLRELSRRPSWSLAIVVVLALGIGANAAMFSGFDAWVLRPLDFPNPQGLVEIQESQPKISRAGLSVSPQNYGDWMEQQTTLESLGALHRHRYNLADAGEPVRLEGAYVSASLFPLLGKRPSVGRGFTEEDDQPGRPARVALISDRLWRERFEGSREVIGRTIRLDGQVHEIVGVMEPRFRFPEWAEVWTPLGLDVLRGRALPSFHLDLWPDASRELHRERPPGIRIDLGAARSGVSRRESRLRGASDFPQAGLRSRGD